ncbi:acyltransferase [Prosthecomicrobium sp. N25]|uniref:acyltransferase n=1 Tax=Prosthecomicrobium sp. N25 TaxID=3129254 RepID=UPI00307837F7
MPGLNAAFLSADEVRELGLAHVGKDALIHRLAVLVRPETISIGDHTRIDPFVVLSAREGVEIGRNVHVGAHTSLTGRARIVMEDFSAVSHGVRVFSSSDDFEGLGLTNPTVPEEFRAARTAPVRIGRHAIVGAGSVLLPGAVLAEGTGVGALSLVASVLDPWTLYAGVPVRRLRDRQRKPIALEAAYLARERE